MAVGGGLVEHENAAGVKNDSISLSRHQSRDAHGHFLQREHFGLTSKRRMVFGVGSLPWREAGPPNHHDDKVDSGQ